MPPPLDAATAGCRYRWMPLPLNAAAAGMPLPLDAALDDYEII